MAGNNRSLSSSSEALSDMSADEGGLAKAASNNISNSQDNNRITSLEQQNRVLKMELEMYKLRCKQMQEENKGLRQASVSIVSIKYYNFLGNSFERQGNSIIHTLPVSDSVHFAVLKMVGKNTTVYC